MSGEKRARKARPAAARLPRPLRWLFGALLFGIFGAAGVDLAIELARNLSGTAAARHWQPVEARLLDWQLVRKTQMTIRSWAIHRPLDALQASYVYRFAGSEHTGTSVGFTSRADDFSGAWRGAITQRLVAAQAGAPLHVWVDPDQPQRAVIERSLPVQRAVFAAAFMLFPCGIASALAIGTVLRTLGGDTLNKRWLLPLWAVLHGLPAPTIWWLAAPGSIGLGSGFVLFLLLAVLTAGVFGVLLAARSKP